MPAFVGYTGIRFIFFIELWYKKSLNIQTFTIMYDIEEFCFY